ncbi:MAG: SAM-dependent methyltransferase [Acidimicrobiales bacterium]
MSSGTSDESAWPPPGDPIIDTTVAHQGRIYDFLAGGNAHFEVDREAATMQAAAYGGLERTQRDIRANREFIGRGIRYLTVEAGIRQFLDIGTGIPKEDDLHGVAQQTASDAHMVFVDNDDVVLAHAHELMKSTPEGIARFVKGDFYDPPAVLQEAAATLDLTKPTALMLVALLHLHSDDLNPRETLARYLDALPSGSYLAITHLSTDIDPQATEGLRRAAEGANVDYGFALRSKDEFARFLEGLDVIEPGIVPVTSWRTNANFVAPFWSAVARKP